MLRRAEPTEVRTDDSPRKSDNRVFPLDFVEAQLLLLRIQCYMWRITTPQRTNSHSFRIYMFSNNVDLKNNNRV